MISCAERARHIDHVVSSLRVAYEDYRTSLTGRPFAQDLGDCGRPIQMPGDLGLDALSPELLGDAVEDLPRGHSRTTIGPVPRRSQVGVRLSFSLNCDALRVHGPPNVLFRPSLSGRLVPLPPA